MDTSLDTSLDSSLDLASSSDEDDSAADAGTTTTEGSSVGEITSDCSDSEGDDGFHPQSAYDGNSNKRRSDQVSVDASSSDNNNDNHRTTQRQRVQQDAGISMWYTTIKDKWCDKGECLEVGSMEIAAREAHRGGSVKSANKEINKFGGIRVSETQFHAIKAISKSDLGRYLKNFDKLKTHIVDTIRKVASGCYEFVEDQSLLDWYHYGQRSSKGERG